MFQIIAALLSLFVIYLTLKDKREEIKPFFIIEGTNTYQNQTFPGEQQIYQWRTHITIWNTNMSLGLSKNTYIQIKPISDQIIHLHYNIPEPLRIIRENSRIELLLGWYSEDPPFADLVLTYNDRLNHRHRQKIRIRCYVDGNGNGQCKTPD